MKIYIVIAAYNEEKSIKNVVSTLKEEGYSNIVVIDDGSKDDTQTASLNAGATVLRHIINRGQGAALKTGIDYSLDEGADIIVTFDADGQHDAKEIKKMIKPIIEKKVDITLGSRFLNQKSNTPLVKRIILKGGILFTWLISGIKLTDTHNGFRALSRNAAEKIEIKQDRMEHASEIIDEIKRKNLKYVEVPVTIKYTEYSMQKGQSVFNAIRIALRMIYKKVMR